VNNNPFNSKFKFLRIALTPHIMRQIISLKVVHKVKISSTKVNFLSIYGYYQLV